MKNTLYLCLILCLTACADASPERKQVADLMDQLDQAKTVFEANGPETLPMTVEDIQTRLDKVSLAYKARGEQFDIRVGNMLADFKVYKKVFKSLPEKRNDIQKELDLSYAQLKSMDHDLKHGMMPKTEIQANLNKEQDAVLALTASVAQLDTLMTRGRRGYIAKVPGIEALIDSMSSLAPLAE